MPVFFYVNRISENWDYSKGMGGRTETLESSCVQEVGISL